MISDPVFTKKKEMFQYSSRNVRLDVKVLLTSGFLPCYEPFMGDRHSFLFVFPIEKRFSMRNLWRNTLLGFCGVLVAGLSIAVPAAAQETVYAKNGFFIGGVYASLSLGGGLNGRDVLADSDETIIIPSLRRGSGFGIIFGRSMEGMRFEIVYQQTKHDAFWQGFIETSTNHIVDLNMKYCFMRKSIVQPFLLLGIGGEWFSVPDGSASDTLVGDSSYRGVTFNPGGGLAFYVHPRVAISASAGYRIMLVGKARGVTRKFKDVKDSVIGSGPNLTAGLTVTF